MLLALTVESNRYLRVNGASSGLRQIRASLKREPIAAPNSILRQIATTSIRVGNACEDCCPRARHIPRAIRRTTDRRKLDPLVPLEYLKVHRNAGCGFAEHHVQYMCRNRAHSASHFPRRICVICRCCSAASLNSVARLLAMRRLRMASISSALLPVAQTMYVKPNRCS